MRDWQVKRCTAAKASALIPVLGTGYNKWADTNNLVVLYPQASSRCISFSAQLFVRRQVFGSNGCFDW